ncbi:MAG TPA: VOC family protein [Natronosporangium sp.]|nr:VOC family protein [Natronosporangium sp.]
MKLAHLALTVADQARSRRFYETYFGFGEGPATRYDDGVLIIRDGHGFDLALGEGEMTGVPEFLHLGFRCDDPDEVRSQRGRLVADGVPLVEDEDTPTYVGLKCLDPDGYTVEVYWEPPAA